MLILGVHGGLKFEDEDDREGMAYHDGAAVMIADGEVIAGIEEERLSRIKHSNCFPVRAIQYCLQTCNCSLNDVNVIATNWSAYHADLAVKFRTFQDPTSDVQTDGKSLFASQFQRAFGVDVRTKLHLCDHHLAHAWSAFALSGFRQSLVLSIDGDGDNKSGMVLLGKGKQLSRLQEFRIPQSLGQLYMHLIRVLGYDRFDEYKVMGLAPYGDPGMFRNVFEQCYTLLPGGNYKLEPLSSWFAAFDAIGLLSQVRRKGEPFLQVHKDFAATLQETIEKITFHVLRHYQATTGEKYLCLAGGVAHNCTMNGKILNSGLFEKVFVQPAAHDAGGALGAALSAWYEKGPAFPSAKGMAHVYWGSPVGTDDEIEKTLERWSEFLSYERTDSIARKTAGLIAEGAVVGWVQGRSEFGPRALGNRSILADPRPAENKLRINAMIKKREQYRPFAPSVLEEKLPKFFKAPPRQAESPFMIFVLEVREHACALLGAITHVDGTARVQSVSRNTNFLYWELISEFEKITGLPILLNTSFNNNAEPIVDSIDDAVGCFLTTGINYMVAGNYLVTKKSAAEIKEAMRTLAPAIPSWRNLVKRNVGKWNGLPSSPRYAIESIKNRLFGASSFEISEDMFKVLQQANDNESFGDLMKKSGVHAHAADALLSELVELWSNRLVSFVPRAAKKAQEVPLGEAVLEMRVR